MLSEFLENNRDELIDGIRQRIASRSAPRPTSVELRTGVPLFLDQLTETLRHEESATSQIDASEHEIGMSAAIHGKALHKLGFSAVQVIHDYGDICQVVNELAVKLDPRISADDYRVFNKCLDLAMAEAITEFGRQRELSLCDNESERMVYFAHELRNLLSNSLLAFGVLKTGIVGIESTTGALLGRNLSRLQSLIDNTLSEVRLKAGSTNLERVSLAAFIEEIEVFATMEAKAKELKLTTRTPPPDVWIEIDRQILAAAVANLVQNAVKFTPANGHISVHTHVDGDLVLIDVQDECGGLTVDNPEDLFRSHEQQNPDKSGLGLGLGIAREGVRVNGGKIRVRNLPGIGCIFTIELPKMAELAKPTAE